MQVRIQQRILIEVLKEVVARIGHLAIGLPGQEPILRLFALQVGRLREQAVFLDLYGRGQLALCFWPGCEGLDEAL